MKIVLDERNNSCRNRERDLSHYDDYIERLPETKFRDGIQKNIKWYLDNRGWSEEIVSGRCRNYYEKMYGGII